MGPRAGTDFRRGPFSTFRILRSFSGRRSSTRRGSFCLLKQRLAPGCRHCRAVYVAACVAPRAYWCIISTLEAAGFQVRPYQVSVPSFGIWGFAAGGALEPFCPAHRGDGRRGTETAISGSRGAAAVRCFSFRQTSAASKRRSIDSITRRLSGITTPNGGGGTEVQP